MACASEQASKSDKSVSEQLKCPICLDVYNNPRVLNCLHSFCEPCIQSLVTKRQDKMAVPTGILCPLCRTETFSPCPNKPLTEWVKELPVSKPLLHILEIPGRDTKNVKYCEVCNVFNKTTSAKYYCKECEHFHCEDCTLYHSNFPGTRSHHVINIDEMPVEIAEKLTLGKIEYCPQHPDRGVELYCDDDKKFCCFECVYLYHRSCKQLNEMAQLGQSFKEGDRSQQMEKKMRIVLKQIGDIVGELEKASSTIENQAVEIPQKVREIRNKIVHVLDQLVSVITAECGHLKKQHTAELDDKITSMRSLEAAVTTSHSLLDTLMKHGTTKQVYIVIHKLEEHTSDYSTQVTAAQDSMDTVHLRLSVSDDLNKIFRTTQVLARVTITKIHRNTAQVLTRVRDTNIKRKSTQTTDQVTATQSQQSVTIAECVMEKSPLVRIPGREGLTPPWYSEAEYLPGGQLVAVDINNRFCCLMDGSFNVISYVRLPSKPIDLAVIGPTEVVVTLPDTKQLQKVSVVSNTLTRTYTVKCVRVPYSVSRVSDTELAVGWDRGMGIISMDGQEKMYTYRDKSGREIRFSEDDRILADVKRSRVYQAKYEDNAVYCIGYTVHVHLTYTNNLNGPSGLAIDRDGNLYVCSSGTHKVHQVGPTGQPIKIINTGMSLPCTICFNPARDQMTVMNYAFKNKHFSTNQGLKVRFVHPQERH